MNTFVKEEYVYRLTHKRRQEFVVCSQMKADESIVLMKTSLFSLVFYRFLILE